MVQVVLMKMLQSSTSGRDQQSQRKVNEAAKVTLSSMLLIAVFEERVETWTL